MQYNLQAEASEMKPSHPQQTQKTPHKIRMKIRQTKAISNTSIPGKVARIAYKNEGFHSWRNSIPDLAKYTDTAAIMCDNRGQIKSTSQIQNIS